MNRLAKVASLVVVLGGFSTTLAQEDTATPTDATADSQTEPVDTVTEAGSGETAPTETGAEDGGQDKEADSTTANLDE